MKPQAALGGGGALGAQQFTSLHMELITQRFLLPLGCRVRAPYWHSVLAVECGGHGDEVMRLYHRDGGQDWT